MSLAAVGWSGAVHGQTDEQTRARQYTVEGNADYEAGRYATAEQAFRRAFELSGRPGFLWNMAQCARLAGAQARALSLYRQYVEAAPNGSEREQAQRWIAVLAPPDTTPAPVVALPVTPVQPAARQPTQPSAVILDAKPEVQSPHSPRLYEQWWFWAGAGAVVTGVVAAILLSSGGDSAPATQPEPQIRW
jgi:tetratricopeptide (TPR) repeat protein